MSKTKQATKGNHKLGRNKIRCARYRASGRRELRKLKHMLQSNGRSFARSYAARHNLTVQLARLGS